MRKATWLALATLILAAPIFGKCGNLLIHIEGRVEGPSASDLTIVTEVTPDPNWQSQPPISITGAAFVGTVLFDSTKREGPVEDDCSRTPNTVQVILLKNGHELDRVQLNISRDFVKDKSRDYRLRAPILLHSR